MKDVVLDTDAFNEIDDQFAIAYLLKNKEYLNTEEPQKYYEMPKEQLDTDLVQNSVKQQVEAGTYRFEDDVRKLRIAYSPINAE